MNKNEAMNRIVEKVLESPELMAALQEMQNGLNAAEAAPVQKPDMMYVLTQKIKIHTEDGAEEKYHYHPVVGETLLFPGCTENRMVASGNLLELQNTANQMHACCYGRTQFQILAMNPDDYELLQLCLDETVTAILENTHKAVEAVLGNVAYVGQGSMSFEAIYQRILTDMMNNARSTIGTALSADSEIIEKIDDVEYEHDSYDRGCCCDDCCDDEDEDYDEDEDDEDDDIPKEGVFIIRRVN